MRLASQVPRCNKLPHRAFALLLIAWSLPRLSVSGPSQSSEPSLHSTEPVWPQGIDLEWHLPYSCAHHGFVSELLGYLPALQRLIESSNGVRHGAEYSCVYVTGLGPCSNATLAEFAPLERAALLHALAGPEKASKTTSAPGLRYCRMKKQDDGETFAQVCDRPSSDLKDSDNSLNINAHIPPLDTGPSNDASNPLRTSSRLRNRRVVVTHGEPCALKARDHFPAALAVIGRTMTETSTLSAKQRACLVLAAADELWIPTPWGAQVLVDDFKRNELANPAAVAVVPETVDGTFLDPALVEQALDFPNAEALLHPTKLWRYGVAREATPSIAKPTRANTPAAFSEPAGTAATVLAETPSDNAVAQDAAAPVAAPVVAPVAAAAEAAAAAAEKEFRIEDSSDCGLARGHRERQRFVVVSVFKWGHRKGWDVLLEAFWRAFLDPNLAGNAVQDPSVSASSSSGNRSSTSSSVRALPAAAAEVVLCLRTSKPKIGFTGEVFETKFGNRASNSNNNDNDKDDAGGVGDEIRAYAHHFLRRYKPPPPPPPAPEENPSDSPSPREATGVPEDNSAASPPPPPPPAVAQPSTTRSLKNLRDLPAVEVYGQPLSKVALRALVGRADVFALPHRGEGWALPLTEAMALGVPVIATDHSGPSFYLSSNNSWPIPVAFEHSDGSGEPSVAALVESLQSLYTEWRNARITNQSGGRSNGANSGIDSSSSTSKSQASSSVDNSASTGISLAATSAPLRDALLRAGAARARGAQARLDVVERFSGDAVAALMVERLSALAQAALK